MIASQPPAGSANRFSALRIATVAAHFPLHGVGERGYLLERQWPQQVVLLALAGLAIILVKLGSGTYPADRPM